MRSKRFAIPVSESSAQAFALPPEAGGKTLGTSWYRDATVQTPPGSAGPPSGAARSPPRPATHPSFPADP
jgi:hypothetical protein